MRKIIRRPVRLLLLVVLLVPAGVGEAQTPDTTQISELQAKTDSLAAVLQSIDDRASLRSQYESEYRGALLTALGWFVLLLIAVMGVNLWAHFKIGSRDRKLIALESKEEISEGMKKLRSVALDVKGSLIQGFEEERKKLTEQFDTKIKDLKEANAPAEEIRGMLTQTKLRAWWADYYEYAVRINDADAALATVVHLLKDCRALGRDYHFIAAERVERFSRDMAKNDEWKGLQWRVSHALAFRDLVKEMDISGKGESEVLEVFDRMKVKPWKNRL